MSSLKVRISIKALCAAALIALLAIVGLSANAASASAVTPSVTSVSHSGAKDAAVVPNAAEFLNFDNQGIGFANVIITAPDGSVQTRYLPDACQASFRNWTQSGGRFTVQINTNNGQVAKGYATYSTGAGWDFYVTDTDGVWLGIFRNPQAVVVALHR